MKKLIQMLLMLSVVSAISGCKQESEKKDRSSADDMFRRIISLTERFTKKVDAASDSSEWAGICREFEDSLDKISFAYPPDTDLLLTEGQNDTIQTLLQNYINMRDIRIHDLLHPVSEIDSLAADSVEIREIAAEPPSNQADASRNPYN